MQRCHNFLTLEEPTGSGNWRSANPSDRFIAFPAVNIIFRAVP